MWQTGRCIWRCGQITHFALQALVVSIRTVLGNLLSARLNALPAREQDILDSCPLFRFVLLTTICPFSGSSGTGCQIAEDIPKLPAHSA